MNKKSLVDEVQLLAQNFVSEDDSRLSDRMISELIDQIRAEKIIRNYAINETVDLAWLSQPFYLNFYKIEVADDPNITFCNCQMMKANIPPVISLTNPNTNNQDVGIYSLFSTCGKYAYYPRALHMIRNIPSENTLSLFKYYSRYNTIIYATGNALKLRLSPILLYPEDGFIINSAPVLSGSIVTGTVYIVKFGGIFYNSISYNANDTFTGVIGQTTFTGTGTVYLQSQITIFEETTPYPVGGEMAREIVLEILAKEFQVAESQITDIKNDNTDAERQAKGASTSQRQGAL